MPGTNTKNHQLITTTIRSNRWAYAHLQVFPEGHTTKLELDNLEARSFCNTALSQFLGISGSAISTDILKVTGSEFWIRLPARDLSRFAAAVSAWSGPMIGGKKHTMATVACSEWLGALVSQDGESSLWS